MGMRVSDHLGEALAVITSATLRPVLQLVVIAANARKAPARDTTKISAVCLERRVGSTEQGLTEVVEAMAHVWWLQMLHVDTCDGDAGDGEQGPSDGILGVVSIVAIDRLSLDLPDNGFDARLIRLRCALHLQDSGRSLGPLCSVIRIYRKLYASRGAYLE